MLRIENVSKTFTTGDRTIAVLDHVSLQLAAGESASIMGPSGSGKSTLLHIIGTLDHPDSGRILVADENPFELPDRELARFRNRRIGFVFQEHHLLPQCSAIENVLVPTLANNGTETRQRAADRAKELLERVGIGDRLHHRPAELSGGERQRVAIARALIQRPAVLLADEPTGNLDRTTADDIADLLVQVQRTDGVALLVVTHSERIAARFDRALSLIDHRLVPST